MIRSGITVKIEIQDDCLKNTYTDYSQYLCIPISEQERLDESLAQCSVRLSSTPYDTEFAPFLRVRLTYTQTNESTQEPTTETRIWLIAQDYVTKTIGNKTYTHDISLIECTKLLERIVCDTKTVTQPLVDSNGQAVVKSSIAEFVLLQQSAFNFQNYLIVSSIPYKSPYMLDSSGAVSINIMNPRTYFEKNLTGNVSYVNTVVTDYATGSVLYSSRYTYLTTLPDILDTITITGVKTVRIKTTLEMNGGRKSGIYAFDISTMAGAISHSRYSIYDTCKIVLQVAETMRLDELAYGTRIQLAEVTTGDYCVYTSDMQEILSPEFAFGKMTLWEIFSAIGGKLNAIPMLVANNGNLGYKLYFWRLDMTKLTPLIRDSNYNSVYLPYSETKSLSIEQYCSALDSDVDNLIDTDRPNMPSIIEPAIGYLKTPRVETGTVVVEENEVKIVTQYPIERLISVECGYLPDETYVGDITDYVYESAEYGSLSSYTTAFPCKALALCYTYGQKDITGLTFKPDLAWTNAFGLGLLNYYTILRIISLKTGKQLSAVTQLFTDTYDLRFLQFRVQYIPRISARVKVSKSTLEDTKNTSVITYTQGANLVSANHYGEALKGVVERYGNTDKNIVTNLVWLSDVTKIGEVYRYDKEYRVSGVNREIYQDHIKQEVQLTKHFNRYSQYVGADNYLRLFEVSEKQAIERKTVYEEYVIFSYDEPTGVRPVSSLMTVTGLETLAKGLYTSGASNGKVDKMHFRGYTNDGTMVHDWITLPVVTMGIGNTMYIGMQCADNYSAGDKIIASESSGEYYDAQQFVPYADYFGEIYSLEFNLGYCDSGFDPLASTFGANWDIGNQIPDYSLNDTGSFMATGKNKRLLLLKDSREITELSVQLHFVKTKDSGLILGSAIADVNGMMNINTSNIALYVLDKQLSEFEDYITTTRVPAGTISPDMVKAQYIDNILCVPSIFTTVTQSGVAWALVDRDTNRLIVGRNEVVKAKDILQLPSIWCVRGYDKKFN